jgi:hypothetical protein
LPGQPTKLLPSPPATHADGSLTALPVNVSTVSVSLSAGAIPIASVVMTTPATASARMPSFDRLPIDLLLPWGLCSRSSSGRHVSASDLTDS